MSATPLPCRRFNNLPACVKQNQQEQDDQKRPHHGIFRTQIQVLDQVRGGSPREVG